MDFLNSQKKHVKQFFDEDSSWQGGFYKNRDNHFAKIVNRRKKYSFSLLDQVLDNNVETVLDVGCGSGVYLKEFMEKGYNVIGMDLSEAMLHKVRESLEHYDGWKLYQGDIEQIPLKDNEVDIIVCMGVLPYLLKDDKAIEELFRVLKPNGYLLISATNWFRLDQYHTLLKIFFKKMIGKYPEIKEHQPGLSYTSPWFLNNPPHYRFKAYNIRKFKKYMSQKGFLLIEGLTYGFEFTVIRRFGLLPESFLNRLEISMENFLKRFYIPFLSNSGYEYIGLFKKKRL